MSKDDYCASEYARRFFRQTSRSSLHERPIQEWLVVKDAARRVHSGVPVLP